MATEENSYSYDELAELAKRRAERFDRLRTVDVSKYIQKRDGLEYINWVDMLGLLHDNGAAEVSPKLHLNPRNNSSLFGTEKEYGSNEKTHHNYEIDFEVRVLWENGDNETYYWRAPLMNGKNAVMDNSLNQARIWAGYVRQLVKCLAINTGLAFNLYAKSEHTEDSESDLMYHDVMKVKQRIEEAVTAKINVGMDFDDIIKRLGINKKQYDSALKAAEYIRYIDLKLREI